jgi:hypothetical protein
MAKHNGLMWLVPLRLLVLSPAVAIADQVKDDVKRDSHDVKRSIKKTGHRVNEAACTGTKAECEARKDKHRLQEAGDKVGDKVDESTDKLNENGQ